MNRRTFLYAGGSLLATPLLGRDVSSQGRAPMPDVIVILPGLMGSVLQKDGRDLWAFSGSALLRGLNGTAFQALTLRGDSTTADDAGDGVTATRLVPDIHLMPGFWKIDGYTTLTATLRARFALDEGRNYFEFPYDWRRDVRSSARRLARQSHNWLAAWRARSGNRDARLLLIGHSLGGLVARYFVECLEGWRISRRLITFGTPFRGSLNALDALANGIRLGPVVLDGMTTLARSLTSTYQLLPRYPCYDPGSGTLSRPGERGGIPNVDGERARAALEFHREIDRCVEQHSRDEESLRSFRVHPIVGGYQTTYQLARFAGAGLEMASAYPQGHWDGDGTVPEVSAIPIEQSDAGTHVYVAQVHGSLQNTPVVLDHVTKLLAARDLGGLRIGDSSPSASRLSLKVSDAHRANARIPIRATCSEDVPALAFSVIEATSMTQIAAGRLHRDAEGSYSGTLSPLDAGLYRVSVQGPPAAVPVSDVFAVVAD